MRAYSLSLKLFVAALFAVALTTCPTSLAQQAETEQEPAPEQAEPASDDSDEQDNQPKTDQEIRTELYALGNASKLDEAASRLEELIAAEPDREFLHRMRQWLSVRYSSKRDYAAAFEQLEKMFAFREANVDSPNDAAELASNANMLAMYASRVGKLDVSNRAIDRALEVCESMYGDHPQIMLSQITGLVTRKLYTRGGSEDAAEIAQQHLKRLEEFNASEDANETSLQAQIRMVYALANTGAGDQREQYKARLEELSESALEKYPDSSAIQIEYANTRYVQVATSYRDDPEGAQASIEQLRTKLGPVAETNRTVKSILSRLDSLESRIESALKLKQMVGTPAPPLDADAWVNAGDITPESLEGKVVLYDFWAIWCGPCIATFPHLRDWRAEFGDQGFEIVGITRYYGYRWDEEAEKAVRSQEETTPEDEQLAVEKFLQSHDLGHPSILTPEGSELQSNYAVTGIPHAVLIDRKGVIQMIKVGSGPANAEALHAKIKELVAE